MGEGAINFFESMDYLERKCPKCQIKIDYGLTTTFNDKKGCHTCNGCGLELK